MYQKRVILNIGDNPKSIPNDIKIIWRDNESEYTIDDDGEIEAKSSEFDPDDSNEPENEETEAYSSQTLSQPEPPSLLPPSIIASSITSTIRPLDDGTVVVDLEFDVTDATGATEYEARYS